MNPPDHKPPRIVIFSDLDGTLLDHENYSWEPAADALVLCASHDIPVVFATSKTLAEVRHLRTKTGINHPCVVENGGAVDIPLGYFESHQSKVLGKPYLQIRTHLQRTAFRDSFQGFGDWTAAEIASRTGLDIEKARRAKARQSSEPIIWTGPAEDLYAFKSSLERQNLSLLQGGRFYHVVANVTKTLGLEYLLEAYLAKWGERPLTLTLGDGPNDVGMLEWADRGVVIPNAKGNTAEASGDNIVFADKAGPAGWAIEVKKFLRENGYTDTRGDVPA